MPLTLTLTLTLTLALALALASTYRDKAGVRDSAGRMVSAVRATRAIRQGGACLICYLHPLQLTRAARAERLEQFDFGCERERPHAAERILAGVRQRRRASQSQRDREGQREREREREREIGSD